MTGSIEAAGPTAQAGVVQGSNAPAIARDCPVCEATASEPLPYGRDGWRTVACAECGFVYMPQVPSYAAVAEDFEWSKSFAAEAGARLTRAPVFARFDRVTRIRTSFLGKKTPMTFVRRHLRSGRIVDLGCGNGDYLAGLARDFTLHGIDLSAPLAANADRLFRPTGGGAVAAPCIEGLAGYPPAYFDAAILRSYLEHEMRPRELLEAVHRALKPGGIAVVKVPNYASLNRRVMGRRWCGFRFPDHVNYFTPQSLAALALRTGFETRIGLLDRLPTDDNLWAVLTRIETD